VVWCVRMVVVVLDFDYTQKNEIDEEHETDEEKIINGVIGKV
jgi:hypothetical protein